MVKHGQYRTRRLIVAFVSLVGCIVLLALQHPDAWWDGQEETYQSTEQSASSGDVLLAVDVLQTLLVKGRASNTGYERAQFGNGWASIQGCDMRNTILYRDLQDPQVGDNCRVQSGTLQDPYTNKEIQFTRGSSTSSEVQIDHVVALSNAWQTGAQQLTPERRIAFANDPLNLLAVDGAANQQKGSGDAATWLPANKAFRCQYVARQVAVKARYNLWVTDAEKQAIERTLASCSQQTVPSQ